MEEFVYPLKIEIEDTDYTGTVFHSNYLKFMERARSEWLDVMNLGANWRDSEKIHFLVHSLSINYLKPAKLHERVEVVSSVKSLRSASFLLDQYLRSAVAPDKILCRAEIKLVCVDHDLKPCAIPQNPVFKRFGAN